MSAWVRHGSRAIVRGLLLFGLWMVLVDNKHQAEIVTGAVAAAAAAVVGTLVAVERGETARASLAMLRRAYRPFLLLIADSARVTRALVQRLLGRELGGGFRAVRYRATEQTPDARARRILTEWGASLAANRYAIGIDPEAGYLLVHELVFAEGPLDPLELG